jgi:5'-phosphate synthase pdxT subunit
MKYDKLTIGVLALQGDFERHEHQLDLLGAHSVEVRQAAHLGDIQALIIPGGESTTMDHLLDRFELRQPLLAYAQTHAIWGTCAGMILVAHEVENNQAGVTPLDLIDIDVVRMGYGRQVFSFEEPLEAQLNGRPTSLTASFIRAPRITRVGEGVTSMASHDGTPVLVAQGHVLASSFHTELDDDTQLLRHFLDHFVGIGERS